MTKYFKEIQEKNPEKPLSRKEIKNHMQLVKLFKFQGGIDLSNAQFISEQENDSILPRCFTS